MDGWYGFQHARLTELTTAGMFSAFRAGPPRDKSHPFILFGRFFFWAGRWGHTPVVQSEMPSFWCTRRWFYPGPFFLKKAVCFRPTRCGTWLTGLAADSARMSLTFFF